MWLLAHERLLTKVYHAKWKGDSSLSCGLCGEAPKSLDHLFYHCRIAVTFWRDVCAATTLAPFHSLHEMWEASEELGGRAAPSNARDIALSIILAGAWAIWHMRNDAVFKNTWIYTENMWDFTTLLVRDWARELTGAEGVIS
ncbi:hypothetical protein QJS10_CPA09g00760 [Acorus calamus]|uniref:Reverse transcriptase zinc-binding domain-containing protein n=1 Tax=Acorus calamus TaxID=4465 RepID=A0AAV9E6K1_ACOCL|nr:hypothetical protein QJS10_CPA09g00760 [Acorus calamus]